MRRQSHQGEDRAIQSLPNADYAAFLADVKGRIQAARVKAARKVSRELILLYWDIGRAIVEKQQRLGWGDAVIETLAKDIQRGLQGGTGFSARNLRNMRQLYLAYHEDGFWQQAVAKLSVADIPWGHHLLILNKVDATPARLYYIRAAAKLGWSRAVLLNQIKADAYERSASGKKANNFGCALPDHLAKQAEEAMKSRYNLEFLGIGGAVKERELEDSLVARLQQFILELGYGFCFIGRQHRLMLGNKEYFVDLLFYHRFLKTLVAFDLKVVAFEPEHAGKMDFYLNLLNDAERAPDDNPSIGIILCAEKDDVEVGFALKTKMNPIGVAEYQLQSKFPSEFRGKLPTAKQLAEVVRGGQSVRKAIRLKGNATV